MKEVYKGLAFENDKGIGRLEDAISFEIEYDPVKFPGLTLFDEMIEHLKNTRRALEDYKESNPVVHPFI